MGNESPVTSENLWKLAEPFLNENPKAEHLFFSAAGRRVYISFEPASAVEGSDEKPGNVMVAVAKLEEDGSREATLAEAAVNLLTLMD